MTGVGCMVSERMSGQAAGDSDIICFHQTGGNQQNVLSVTLKNETEYLSCDIQFRDQMEANQFSVKIKANFINSAKTLHGLLLIGYTRNKSKLSFVSTEITLWKNDQKIEIETSVNDYHLKLTVVIYSYIKLILSSIKLYLG